MLNCMKESDDSNVLDIYERKYLAINEIYKFSRKFLKWDICEGLFIHATFKNTSER